MDMNPDRSLLELTVGSIEYDFREDDDEVQGNWDIHLDTEAMTLKIEYQPFDDSPYPANTEIYQLVRVR